MNNPNRDLLVLFKQELMTPQAMEHEVSLLHDLLYTVERVENVSRAHEIIDLNSYKLITKQLTIRKHLRAGKEKAFVFLNNKN
jgi:hypothetical protein